MQRGPGIRAERIHWVGSVVFLQGECLVASSGGCVWGAGVRHCICMPRRKAVLPAPGSGLLCSMRYLHADTACALSAMHARSLQQRILGGLLQDRAAWRCARHGARPCGTSTALALALGCCMGGVPCSTPGGGLARLVMADAALLSGVWGGAS